MDRFEGGRGVEKGYCPDDDLGERRRPGYMQSVAIDSFGPKKGSKPFVEIGHLQPRGIHSIMVT